ncbi:MAG: winged helix-turn-helix domain-containing protein [Proteobacteria bacterium]|nr:winged helix-turn-helix domain-containing protein [Pseudomonadota bacterium]
MNQTQSSSKFEEIFELGKLYFDRTDFAAAEPKLKAAFQGFLEERNYEKYLKAMNLLLRSYAEREMNDEIAALKDQLQDLVLREGFELNSKTYYTFSVCEALKGNAQSALEYVQKALAIALATDNKEDISYAINGLAVCYRMQKKYNEALREIYNLRVFFEVMDFPEVRMSSQILNARILIDLGRCEEAIELLWQTYDSLKVLKTMAMQIHLLSHLGYAYRKLGDNEMARLYTGLALKGCDPVNMKRIYRSLTEEMEKLGGDVKTSYDLVFDLENHLVQEKKLGKVDFKNQFILLDLLRLFCQNQGQVYSKEYLVENIWKQSYDPSVHDNKIYVTIKRLRKLIEPEFEKPKYIFRAKNGYFMNKSAKVLLENNRGGLQ